ncbi:unnamed protein product, partial [Owenia fusiformis]
MTMVCFTITKSIFPDLSLPKDLICKKQQYVKNILIMFLILNERNRQGKTNRSSNQFTIFQPYISVIIRMSVNMSSLAVHDSNEFRENTIEEYFLSFYFAIEKI